LDWGTVAQWFGVAIAVLALNAGTIQFLISRRESSRKENYDRIEHLGKRLYDLAASLPLEYVRREDWIRFGSSIDKKLDDMRDEMRDELRDLKDSYVKRD
jgi:hypothetical protein